jgi:hypothetical protein
MTDEEREHLIKEIRLAVLHDIEMALARLRDNTNPGDERRNAAEAISYFLKQRALEISMDKADRPHINR